MELKPNEEAAPSLHDNSLCNESGCACLCFDCTMMRERAQEASDDKKGCKPLDPSLPEKEEPVQNETETPTKDAPNETIEKLTYPDHNGVLCRQDECRCNCYDCLVMQKHA